MKAVISLLAYPATAARYGSVIKRLPPGSSGKGEYWSLRPSGLEPVQLQCGTALKTGEICKVRETRLVLLL